MFVAKPLVEKGHGEDVQAIIYRRKLGGLAIRGVDPYELNL